MSLFVDLKYINMMSGYNIRNKIRANFHEAFWNSLLIVYLLICESSIKMFNCSKIDDNSDILYLWYAGSNQCYESYQIFFIILFSTFLLFSGYR